MNTGFTDETKPAWPALDRLATAPGYQLTLMRAEDIDLVRACLLHWYPDISVGAGRCFLEPSFYYRSATLAGMLIERDILPILVMCPDGPAAFYCLERNTDARSLYCKLQVIHPTHRGRGLGGVYLRLAEAIAQLMGMEMIYGFVSLKNRINMLAAEKIGWRLAGIMPGLDREQIAPGTVKRVYEAIYVKLLVGEEAFFVPPTSHLSPNGEALASLLFPELCRPLDV